MVNEMETPLMNGFVGMECGQRVMVPILGRPHFKKSSYAGCPKCGHNFDSPARGSPSFLKQIHVSLAILEWLDKGSGRERERALSRLSIPLCILSEPTTTDK